jgi:membrane-bound serine protease (ClpP class)
MKKPYILAIIFVFVSHLFNNLKAETFDVRHVGVLTIESAITPATVDYLKHQLPRFPSNSIAIIKINTPGGLITSTKEIITTINSQKFPVVVWVTPAGASAASAGAIIAATAHFILMSPGSNLGAATPVGIGGDIKESDAKSKVLNDLKALVRSFATMRDRPSKPFEDMISEAKSFTDKEALETGISNGTISNINDVVEVLKDKKFKLDNKTFELTFSAVEFHVYPPTLGQKILGVIADPSLAFFIFLLGLALIYFELQAPGGYIAGGVGISLLLLSAISFQVLPLNWGALALIIFGMILIILEVYITSYGLLGLGGLTALIFGSLFLFHGESGFISVEYKIIISTIIGILASVGFLLWYLWKEDKKWKNVSDFFIPIGSQGTVVSRLPGDNTYQIKVRGEIWKSISDEKLEIGDKVIVTEIYNEHLTARVKKHA